MNFQEFKKEYKNQIAEIVKQLPLKVVERRPYNNLENKLLSLFNHIISYRGVDVYNTTKYEQLYVQAEQLFEDCFATNYLPRDVWTKEDKQKNKIWLQFCKLKGVNPKEEMLDFLIKNPLFNFPIEKNIKRT